MAEPLVHIIVVCFNGKRHLETMLPGLLKTRYSNFRVFLVDNASADRSADYVEQTFPSISVLRNDTNVGFGRANNRAIDDSIKAGAAYVVLLNPDVQLVDDLWLEEAIQVVERSPKVGMVGFRLVDSLQLKGNEEKKSEKDIQHIDGCAMLIRVSLLNGIGTFDPGYFLYAEEVDLERRAMEAGYELKQIDVPIYHEAMGAAKSMPVRVAYWTMQSTLRLKLKMDGILSALARALRILDVACNPFPFSYDHKNLDHIRLRNVGSRWAGTFLLAAAILNNFVRLPATYAARWRDRAKCRTARHELEARFTHASPLTRAGKEEPRA